MGGEEFGVVHKTVNPYDPDRFIFFMSDCPHLEKTVRNNIFNSRASGGKRLLKVIILCMMRFYKKHKRVITCKSSLFCIQIYENRYMCIGRVI